MNPLEVALDVVSALCLVLGCALALSAALALVRFPDLLSRMHAGTKPQVLGLLLVLLGAALQVQDISSVVKIALVAVFQLVTAPVAAHLLSRSSYRAGVVDTSSLLQDDLAPQLGRGQRSTRDDAAGGPTDGAASGSAAGTADGGGRRPPE